MRWRWKEKQVDWDVSIYLRVRGYFYLSPPSIINALHSFSITPSRHPPPPPADGCFHAWSFQERCIKSSHIYLHHCRLLSRHLSFRHYLILICGFVSDVLGFSWQRFLEMINSFLMHFSFWMLIYIKITEQKNSMFWLNYNKTDSSNQAIWLVEKIKYTSCVYVCAGSHRISYFTVNIFGIIY